MSAQCLQHPSQDCHTDGLKSREVWAQCEPQSWGSVQGVSLDGVVGLGIVLGLDMTEAVRASLALVRTFGNFFK